MLPTRKALSETALWAGALVSAVCLLAATLPDYPVRPASAYAISAQGNGVTIGVQPVEDIKEQKAYFGTEVIHRGFIPVFIVIENGPGGDSVLFYQTNVGYGGAFYNFTPNLGTTYYQDNVLKKQIKSKTLSPGTSVHGFLYIPVPKKGPRDKIHLQVPITKTGTSETYVLNLLF